MTILCSDSVHPMYLCMVTVLTILWSVYCLAYNDCWACGLTELWCILWSLFSIQPEMCYMFHIRMFIILYNVSILYVIYVKLNHCSLSHKYTTCKFVHWPKLVSLLPQYKTNRTKVKLLTSSTTRIAVVFVGITSFFSIDAQYIQSSPS